MDESRRWRKPPSEGPIDRYRHGMLEVAHTPETGWFLRCDDCYATFPQSVLAGFDDLNPGEITEQGRAMGIVRYAAPGSSWDIISHNCLAMEVPT